MRRYSHSSGGGVSVTKSTGHSVVAVTNRQLCRKTSRHVANGSERGVLSRTRPKAPSWGAPLWRRGWLGYSNIDQRYEWITIDSVNSTIMTYVGATGSGPKLPISMDGVFTDQGVAGEETVGKRVGIRTVIRIESDDRHVFELYFKRPGDKEVLALRSVYVRVPQ
jgi:hypothetical protein